jgi:hypothetical protein
MRCKQCNKSTRQGAAYHVRGDKLGIPGKMQRYDCPHCGAVRYMLQVDVEDVLKQQERRELDRQASIREVASLRVELHKLQSADSLAKRLRG